MDTSFPTKLKVTGGLFIGIGALYLLDWFDGDYKDSSYLVFGFLHIALAIGLFARINAARIVSILACIGGVLVSLIVAALGGLWGYAINSSDEATVSSILGGETTDAQTDISSEIMNIFQTIPWLIALTGIMLVAIYIWVFLYLTNEEAVSQFKKVKSADT